MTKLDTHDVYFDSEKCQQDSFPSEKEFQVYGDYCYADEAIAIIKELREKIANLEKELV